MVTDTLALVPGATEEGTEIPVMTRSGSGEGVRSFPGRVVGSREGFLVGTVPGVPGTGVGSREGFLVGTVPGVPGTGVGSREGFLVGTVPGVPGIMVGSREGFLVGMVAGVPVTDVGRVTGREEGDPTMRLLAPMLFVSSSSRTWSVQSAFTRI